MKHPLILHIDTALPTAYISLAEGENILFSEYNYQQQEHAAFLHLAIENSLRSCKKNVYDLDAVAVNEGPGSYTGLRVGMATAKGICFAIKKPLITVNSLFLLAYSVKDATAITSLTSSLICPAIDARRMEVFMAVYTYDMKVMKAPFAAVVSQNTQDIFPTDVRVLLTGSGAEKVSRFLNPPPFETIKYPPLHNAMSSISLSCFCQKKFADLILTEPNYIKAFHDNS